jgi:hypothetical protein
MLLNTKDISSAKLQALWHKYEFCTCAVTISVRRRMNIIFLCTVPSTAVKVEHREKVSEVSSLHRRYAQARNFRINSKKKAAKQNKIMIDSFQNRFRAQPDGRLVATVILADSRQENL